MEGKNYHGGAIIGDKTFFYDYTEKGKFDKDTRRKDCGCSFWSDDTVRNKSEIEGLLR
jgi:hypothetical protein